MIRLTETNETVHSVANLGHAQAEGGTRKAIARASMDATSLEHSGADLTSLTGEGNEEGAGTLWQGVRFPLWVSVSMLLAFASFVFAWRVEERGLWSSHEGRAAQNAQQMLRTGHWLIPTLITNDPEVQKPPMYYWAVAAFSLLGGGEVSAWTVRLPSVLAALTGIGIVFLFGRRLWDLETGLLAGIILTTTTRYAWLARVGRIDMLLSLVVLLALFVFWREFHRDEQERTTKRWLGFYALLALGVLIKGPIAVVLTMLPIATYLWARGEPILPVAQRGAWGTWHRMRLLPGLLAVALIAGPWFAYAFWATQGAYFWEFVVHHNFDRALGTSSSLKSGPVWFYIPRLLVDCFPWSILLPAAGLTLWKHRQRLVQREDPWSQQYLFLLSWVISQFVLLTLVSFKRADYLLPVYPAVALLLAGWMRDRFARFEDRNATRPQRNPRRRARWVLISAFAMATLTAPLLLWATIEFLKKGVVESLMEFSLAERHLNLTDRFMMGHVERLLRENWPLLGISAVVIVGCVWLFQTGWHERRNQRMIAGLALPWLVCFLFQIHLILPAIDPLREMSRFAEVIRTLATPERPIYYFGKFDPDLVFHAGPPARLVGDWEELVSLGEGDKPCFVVMKASQLPWVKRDPRTRNWEVVADNRHTSFGDHRDARILLTNVPFAVADHPRRDEETSTRSL
ncbi:Undecaprenyl phosphate-alpha-4-amino-4-deoxy-L-arabinose arabinosyl transferase [Planctomycetes bacterium Pan216]|uniref:Undecaprenyl phosphate-alpha-4-amino-4-deoxy-L-arabinose arabinosyl transferase n=1 Tax=Kolteria novifilia TaxID=2527975 RepID=A0A518B3N8_9BACT|nr:Undecaprenyl phosphate-alpha-4-amino-4-deoxy-L-arabinose arabinosyl transferase [Planctomycetes bacterium Pan216]